MKYLVSSAATLNMANGDKFDLAPGIHSDFSEEVKNHWAFNAYAKPLDEKDFEKEQQHSDLAMRVELLDGEIADLHDKIAELQKLLALEKNNVTELTEQRDARDQVITEHLSTIAELQKLLAEKETVKEPDSDKGTENAKKQPATNK